MKIIFGCVVFSLALVRVAHPEPLVIGYSAVSSVFLPFWIGKEAGFYKKEGLDAQQVYIASSTTMAQAMFARQVAISTVNSGSVVNSTLQGGDLILMGAVMNAAAFYIMTRPEIANVQDLKGKKSASRDWARLPTSRFASICKKTNYNLTATSTLSRSAACLSW